jgi:hypothetical protein
VQPPTAARPEDASNKKRSFLAVKTPSCSAQSAHEDAGGTEAVGSEARTAQGNRRASRWPFREEVASALELRPFYTVEARKGDHGPPFEPRLGVGRTTNLLR